MGKRSNFERVPRDFYPTPYEAVLPLNAHLNFSVQYTEPCAGDGRLVDHLTNLGHIAVDKYDIEPRRDDIIQKDFRDVKPQGDYVITNPPWDRKILHPMIEYFAIKKKIPTWLLFDADWMHTKQSVEYMSFAKKIVSIGRVKWIEGSKSVGKDNCCWYLFDASYVGPTMFYGR